MKKQSDIRRLRHDLLSWYDLSGRTLPWRIRPEDRNNGVVPDPYAIWLSEIMLQQTTVPHATPYWLKFLEAFPTVKDLAAADRDRILAMWAGLGYYARARNLHKCAQMVAYDYDGVFPNSETELLKLPGIGAYTAATIAAICFDEPTNVVDGNVERVISRIYRVETPLPKAKNEIRALAGKIADPDRPGDYGQALMDLGATICVPKNPNCEICPWDWACAARKQGNPEKFPLKIRKQRPVKYGAAFALICDGHILLRKRPDQGLLGGMLELPGTGWEAAAPEDVLNYAPSAKNWEKCDLVVRHIFTHFELRLDVYRANAKDREIQGIWADTNNLTAYAIPTLTKKAIKLALT